MRQSIPWWRRKILVHPIQRKYFVLSMVQLLFCGFLMMIVVFLPLKLAATGLFGAPATMPNPWLAYALAARIWPAFLLTMVATGLLSFLVTHKFAGPLYSIGSSRPSVGPRTATSPDTSNCDSGMTCTSSRAI